MRKKGHRNSFHIYGCGMGYTPCLLCFSRNMYDVSCFAGVCVIFLQIAGLHSLDKKCQIVFMLIRAFFNVTFCICIVLLNLVNILSGWDDL